MEIWKDIPDFNKYEASTTGKIRNKTTLKELSLNNLRGGYIRVSLQNNKSGRKAETVHRLIAKTFIHNPKNKYTVNHKNHNKLDNRVENLEWASTTEQNRHKRKIPKEKQRLISSRKVWRIDMKTDKKLQLYETIKDASKWIFDNGLTTVKEFNGGNSIKTSISAVCQKKNKISYGYKWEYDDSDRNKYTNEIWKTIPKELIHNKEGYKISNYGRVENHKGRITEGHHKPNNYRWVSIAPKQYLLHILVAKVFFDGYSKDKIVNHKDGDKTNAKLSNLEFCSYSENSQHAHDNELNKSAKKVIVLNKKTNEVKKFKSIILTSRYVGVNHVTLGKNLKKYNLYVTSTFIIRYNTNNIIPKNIYAWYDCNKTYSNVKIEIDNKQVIYLYSIAQICLISDIKKHTLYANLKKNKIYTHDILKITSLIS